MRRVKKVFRYALPFMLSLAGVLSAAAGPTSVRQCPLPDGSIIQMKVPVSWLHDFTAEPGELPPSITLRPQTGENVAVLVTPLPPAGKHAPPPTAATIREHVERAADKARPQAVEHMITIREFRGTSGVGYYFSTTDKAPKPGEYKIMTQGIFGAGDLIVAFAVLKNEEQQPIVDDALTMIKGAVHSRAGPGGPDHAAFRRGTDASR
jgi:hypothetical protein